jgi:hypothetical protein
MGCFGSTSSGCCPSRTRQSTTCELLLHSLQQLVQQGGLCASSSVGLRALSIISHPKPNHIALNSCCCVRCALASLAAATPAPQQCAPRSPASCKPACQTQAGSPLKKQRCTLPHIPQMACCSRPNNAARATWPARDAPSTAAHAAGEFQKGFTGVFANFLHGLVSSI